MYKYVNKGSNHDHYKEERERMLVIDSYGCAYLDSVFMSCHSLSNFSNWLDKLKQNYKGEIKLQNLGSIKVS